MSKSTSFLFAPFRTGTVFFFKNIIPLSLLQIPGLTEEIAKYSNFEALEQSGPIARYTFAIVFFWLQLSISFWTLGGVYRYLEEKLAGNTPSVAKIYSEMFRYLPRFILAALLIAPLGVLSSDPFLLVVILVFVTLYLFVPLTLITDRSASLMTVLNRSWRMSARTFFPIFTLVLISNVVALVELFGTSRLFYNSPSPVVTCGIVVGSAVFTLIFGGLVGSIVACYFKELNRGK